MRHAFRRMCSTLPRVAHSLRIDASFVSELPADPEEKNFIRQVSEGCFSFVQPTPSPGDGTPTLLLHSKRVSQKLGIPETEFERPEFVEALSGHRLLEGAQPYAMCYGGHQFGSWANQLGDGRAITVAEVRCPRGLKWELQLKGAGQTPYSRFADGRAVLRSSIREFLCSEAMGALGIPTTDALSLTTLPYEVLRDMFYTGDAKPERAAVVCRVAPSFLRFGSFEIWLARERYDVIQQLADYAIKHHFPHLQERQDQKYLALLEEVVDSSARLAAQWQSVGFVHGVLNTDNMSLLGLTIDYGPFGWLDAFNPMYTPNLTDRSKRYSYLNQPRIVLWNVTRFATTLLKLVDEKQLISCLEKYQDKYNTYFHEAFSRKLGFKSAAILLADEAAATKNKETPALLDALFNLMRNDAVDFTCFFRALCRVPFSALQSADSADALEGVVDFSKRGAEGREEWQAWLARYAHALSTEEGSNLAGETGEAEDAARLARMASANPIYILRNAYTQQAIEQAERGDHTLLHHLHRAVLSPFSDLGCDYQQFTRPCSDDLNLRPGVYQLS